MAAVELLLDLRRLRSFACEGAMPISQGRGGNERVQHGIPAPGGPIKIILTPSVAVGRLPPAWPTLSSSSFTRDSSLLTKSRSDCTVSSPMGAIVAV